MNYYAAAEKSDNRFLENLPKSQRVWELDFIRGFCIFMMIVDHTMYLLAYTFGFAWFRFPVAGQSVGMDLCLFARWYWTSNAREIVHPIILFLFFSVSGISSSFSRSNLKRTAELAVLAVLYSLVTLYIQNDLNVSESFVHFGVLHMLALSLLIYLAVTSLIKLAVKNPRASKWTASAVFLSIAIVVVMLYFFYVPPKNTPLWLFFLFPPDLYFTQAQVSPGDFFPMIPWSSFFFFGAAAGPILYPRKRSLLPALNRGWHRPFSFLGRHALIIYLLHIIVLTLIFALISFLFVTPGNWIIF